LKSKLTNVGTGEKPQAESPPQAGEATREKAKMEAEEEGVGAEKSAEAAPGHDFRATVEAAEEEMPTQAEPNEPGHSPQPTPSSTPRLYPNPLVPNRNLGLDDPLPELLQSSGTRPAPPSSTDALSRLPPTDYLHHPDIRARAVYWMNRAFVAAPGASVRTHDVCCIYKVTFDQTGVAILDDGPLVELIAKMFRGASTGRVRNGAGSELGVIKGLAWKDGAAGMGGVVGIAQRTSRFWDRAEERFVDRPEMFAKLQRIMMQGPDGESAGPSGTRTLRDVVSEVAQLFAGEPDMFVAFLEMCGGVEPGTPEVGGGGE